MASRDPAHVARGSRFIADIIARCYERTIRTYSRGRLLDLGCGHVPLFGLYRHLVESSVCVDWRNTFHSNTHLDAFADLNDPLPFRSESFDTIILTDVLEHIAEPAPLMREVSRILRTKGNVIIGVPFFYWLHEQPHDYYRFTEFGLRRLCQLSGLRILECEPYGGLPEVLLDLTAKGIYMLPEFTCRCLEGVHALAVKAARGAPVRRLFEQSGKVFPLGYIVVSQKDSSPQTG